VDLAQPLNETLLAVADAMAGAIDPWWVIGSAAVALYGVGSVTVADVDVLLSPADAERVLPGLGIAAQRGPGHPLFRSALFGTWRAHPLPVEFMAGFEHCRHGRWRLLQPATRLPVQAGAPRVYVPAREELRDIIASFGRPKDLERVLLLDAAG
jgi:hypothetical protein